MKRSSTCGSGATTTRAWSTPKVLRPGTSISRSCFVDTPIGLPSQWRRRLETSSARSIPATVNAWMRRPGSCAHDTSSSRPACEALSTFSTPGASSTSAVISRPVSVWRLTSVASFGLQAFDRHVERLTHGPEHEVEAGQRRLAFREERREVEARRVGLAVGEPLGGPELDAVRRRPDRRALDTRLEAERRRLERRAHLLRCRERVVEHHAHRALARDRAAREGRDRRLLDVTQLAALARLLRARAGRNGRGRRNGTRQTQSSRDRTPKPSHSHPCPKAKEPARSGPASIVVAAAMAGRPWTSPAAALDGPGSRPHDEGDREEITCPIDPWQCSLP